MRETSRIASTAGATAVCSAAILLCAFGCRQIETPAIASPAVAVDASTHSPHTVSAYRIPTDDEPAARLPEDVQVSLADCKFEGTRGPDQFFLVDDHEPGPRPGEATQGLVDLGEKCGGAADCRPAEACKSPADFRTRFCEILATTRDDVWHDFGNFYTGTTAIEFTAILAPAAVFANSEWDADVGTWYQSHVRSVDTNRAANFFRPLGNGFYTIPFYVSAKFVGEYFDDSPGMALLGQFGDRASRAILVGSPLLLTTQYATGGGRPSDYADQSYWHPFHGSHGASGHAFMGAVPFLTLAGMTDDPLAKCFFFACSPWTGVSRINDNVHYLSQVWLGWWMAYLACDAVNKTESQKGPLTITPLLTPEMSGVGVVYEH